MGMSFKNKECCFIIDLEIKKPYNYGLWCAEHEE